MPSPNQGAPEQQTVLSKVEARQGVTGQNVLVCFGSVLPLLSSPLPRFTRSISLEPR
jgi:hypothetical protein